MKRISLLLVIAASMLLASCMVAPGPYGPPGYGPPGYGFVGSVPVLPPVVYLGSGPDYYYRGYRYRYDHDRWMYYRPGNRSWNHLPRDHYPREVRRSGKGQNRGWGNRSNERNWPAGRGHRSDEGRWPPR